MRGQIRKRGKNSWAVIVYLGRDPETGKDRRKWFSHRTRIEAERHLAQLVSYIHGGGALPSTRLSLGDYLRQWLDAKASAGLAPTTMRSYQETVRVHLAPELGSIPLQRLSPESIDAYCKKKLQTGLSTTSVRYQVMVLHQALERAVRRGLLARNPCDMVQPPAPRRQEIRVWDDEQVRLFLAEAKRSSVHYRLYLTALLTGLRQGELLGLRWRDVDLLIGTINVQQQFYRLGGQQIFSAPKTGRGRRMVALPPIVVEELRKMREEQLEQCRLFGAEYQDKDLIFCQPNGKPLHAHNVAQRDFRRVLSFQASRRELRARGVSEELLPKPLPRIRFHDLRHCHATLLLQQGVHPKVVQERLGHSTVGMTLDTYSHVLPGMQERAIKALEAVLSDR